MNLQFNSSTGYTPKKLSGCLFLINSFLFFFLLNLNSLDLNAQCNPSPPKPIIDGNPCEWPGLLSNALFPSGFEHDIFNVNTSQDDQFTQGSSDTKVIQGGWTYNLGNTNNKTDIANAGSFFKNLGTDASPEFHLYFFGDRTSLNGNANFGFWFFRAPVGTNAIVGNTGSFSGDHTLDNNPNDQNYTGDIFIVSAFEGGGAHPQMTIYNLIVANNNAGFDFQLITTIDPGVSTQYGNAAVNTQFYNVPTYTRENPPAGSDGDETWEYLQSNGDAGYPATTKIVKINGQDVTVHAGAFFEGDLNLSALGISPCFSTFLLATRNSQSLNASLQDFVTGELNITPPPPTVQGDEKCFGFAATATATCTGSTTKWYDAATGGNLVASGVTSITKAAGTAAGTYTYYVSCANGPCESSRTQVSIVINPRPTIDGLITGDNGANDLNNGVQDNTDDVFYLNTNKFKVVNFTATSTSGTGTTTFAWAELSPSSADDISFTFNSDGTATFTINSLTGISDFYDFRVTGTDAKGCVNTDDVRIVIQRSSPPCLVTGPNPCPGTSANYKYDPDNNSTANAIPADFTALWTIVTGDATKPNSNGATISGSATGNSVNVNTQLNCNSEFTIRITLTSTTGLTTRSCELRVLVVDNTPPAITNCPADVVLACGASIEPANTGFATATDACTVQVTYADRVVDNCSRKAITRTWTAIDPCGNKSTCVQLITVTDNVAPVITCPPNKTVALGTALTCGASTLPANTGTATANDACTGTTNVIVYYKDIPQTNNNQSCVNFIRRWYAADASGNVSTCDQTIEFAAPAIQTQMVKTTGTQEQVETAVSRNSIPRLIDNTAPGLQVKAFPNPFTNKVYFQFSSPETGRANLEVYTIMGQKLAVVYEGIVKAGEIRNVQYDARKISRAMLMYRLSVNGKSVNGKLTQMK